MQTPTKASNECFSLSSYPAEIPNQILSHWRHFALISRLENWKWLKYIREYARVQSDRASLNAYNLCQMYEIVSLLVKPYYSISLDFDCHSSLIVKKLWLSDSIHSVQTIFALYHVQRTHYSSGHLGNRPCCPTHCCGFLNRLATIHVDT